MTKKLPPAIRILITAFSALAGAVLIINIFGSIHSQFKGFQFDIQGKVLKDGCTRVEIPPVGYISADTHNLPLEITVTLNNIELDTVKELIETSPDRKQLELEVQSQFYNTAWLLVLKMLLLAGAGGLFGVFLISKSFSKEHLHGAAGSILIFALFTGAVFHTYDAEKFYAPQFEGILEAAPWVVSTAEKTITDLQTFRAQIITITDNINELSRKLDNIQPVADRQSSLRILHVSDIHNNPAAFDFILKTADAFDVDLIIDTGDISDLGTPLEALLLERMNQLQVPYLFVPGNHETSHIISALKKIRQVTVLEDPSKPYKIEGLTILGIPDPNSTGSEVNLSDSFDWKEYLESIGFKAAIDIDKVNEADNDSNGKVCVPDIIAVHNPDAVNYLKCKAPVIITGHSHKTSIIEQERSVIINAGTTGGAGLRGLQYEEDVPYTAVLLHFAENEENSFKLTAADTLQIGNIFGQLNLQRNVY